MSLILFPSLAVFSIHFLTSLIPLASSSSLLDLLLSCCYWICMNSKWKSYFFCISFNGVQLLSSLLLEAGDEFLKKGMIRQHPNFVASLSLSPFLVWVGISCSFSLSLSEIESDLSSDFRFLSQQQTPPFTIGVKIEIPSPVLIILWDSVHSALLFSLCWWRRGWQG